MGNGLFLNFRWLRVTGFGHRIGDLFTQPQAVKLVRQEFVHSFIDAFGTGWLWKSIAFLAATPALFCAPHLFLENCPRAATQAQMNGH